MKTASIEKFKFEGQDYMGIFLIDANGEKELDVAFPIDKAYKVSAEFISHINKCVALGYKFI